MTHLFDPCCCFNRSCVLCWGKKAWRLEMSLRLIFGCRIVRWRRRFYVRFRVGPDHCFHDFINWNLLVAVFSLFQWNDWRCSSTTDQCWVTPETEMAYITSHYSRLQCLTVSVCVEDWGLWTQCGKMFKFQRLLYSFVRQKVWELIASNSFVIAPCSLDKYDCQSSSKQVSFSTFCQ